MKTPEEIDRLELLAASYACDYRDSPNKTNGIPDSYLVYSIAYDAFLDGYKAAKDQLADADKVMPEWISVKDRLPDIYQRVLILIRGRVFISSIEEEYGDEYRDGVITFWDGDWDWPEVTHWMPLPAPPEEEK